VFGKENIIQKRKILKLYVLVNDIQFLR